MFRYYIVIPFVMCLILITNAQKIVLEVPVKMLALGDSYTIGESVAESERWPNQLIDTLRDKGFTIDELDIIASTGWKTIDLTRVINSKTPDADYNLVSLLVGVNNQYQKYEFSLYNTEFEELLLRAIEFTGGNQKRVFVLSIPDYGYTPFGSSNQETITQEINAYNEVNKWIATFYGVKYFDITPISREGLNRSELIAWDGLHPSGEMYREWVKIILQGIDLSQKEVRPVEEITSLEKYTTGKQVLLYPNPSGDFISIKTEDEKISGVLILNNLGEVIFNSGSLSGYFYVIDSSEFLPGIYICQIAKGAFGKTATEIFIKY